MTDRLYYIDPYLRAFDAIVERTAHDGDRLIVRLDRSAFYPTSGGQPFDTGMLGGFRVVEVADADDGGVAHLMDPSAAASSFASGSSVHGVVDWERRFDHMQQHTGQHVLSAAFDKRFHVRTVSFHLGADVSTIDLARELSPSEIAAAEDAANNVVWEDRPVAIRFADAEEAARMPLRKESHRGGTLRLIDIEGFDLSACGGTHVSRTGAIGVIAVAGWERFKGGQRVQFLCGGRALKQFRASRDVLTESVRLLSVLPSELPGAIQRMQADAKEQKRAMGSLQEELSAFRAEALAASAESTTAGRLVARAVDTDATGLKYLATAVAARPGHVVVLVSTSKPTLVVVARSSDVGSVASQQVIAALTAQFGGRGGGKPDLAQAGGLDAAADAILATARAAVIKE